MCLICFNFARTMSGEAYSQSAGALVDDINAPGWKSSPLLLDYYWSVQNNLLFHHHRKSNHLCILPLLSWLIFKQIQLGGWWKRIILRLFYYILLHLLLCLLYHRSPQKFFLSAQLPNFLLSTLQLSYQKQQSLLYLAEMLKVISDEMKMLLLLHQLMQQLTCRSYWSCCWRATRWRWCYCI